MPKLLFLISAPRSGSSLLQQILNSHPAIYSLPEPWLMLPLVYLTKEDKEGRNAYNEAYAKINLRQFLDRVPNGRDNFQERIKEIGRLTYQDAVPKEAKYAYFLDKTPRYYHIVEELLEWYPDAKCILLARNPAAVFCSIMNYNFKGRTDWLSKNDRLHDIFTAPEVLCKYKNDSRVIFTRYEDLINHTPPTVKMIFQYLGLESTEEIQRGSYQIGDAFRHTSSIDQKSVGNHTQPVTKYLDGWKNTIDSHQKKRLLLDYLEKLGKETFTDLGYSFDSSMQTVKNIPTQKPLFTFSLKQLSNNYNKGLSLKQQLIIKSIKKTGIA